MNQGLPALFCLWFIPNNHIRYTIQEKKQKIIKFTIASKPLWLLACTAIAKSIFIPCQSMPQKFGKLCGMKGRTLLTEFIKRKLNSHQTQPTAGFSDRKYLAALSMLTEFSIRCRAEKLNISYNTYRRWATESAFKRLVQTIIDEFASTVIQHVKKKAISCHYEDFKNLNWSEMLDANSYSKSLKKHLQVLYLRECKTSQNRCFVFAMCSILNHTRNISDEMFNQITNCIEQTNKFALKLLFMTARAITQKYSLNVADKSFIRQMLNVSERLIFQ